MGPCPKCGSDGKIPDGIYSNFENKLFAILESIDDVLLFKNIQKEIKRDLQRNKSPKNIKRKLKKSFSKYNSLWDLIPETKQDAYMVIQIILSIIAIAISLGSCSKENKTIIINQYLDGIYRQVQPNTPYDNHTLQKSQPSKSIEI